MSEPHLVGRARAIARIDLAPAHRQPAATRVVLATMAAIVASLLADAALVKICTLLFPSTRNFSHFRLSDYGVLTIVGVTAAGLGWAMVTRVTASPRWLFVRLAVLVTLVLWLPDGWLLLKGESPRAVAVLMIMHLAIALVTYNLLVHGAAVGRTDAAAAGAKTAQRAAFPPAEPPAVAGTATDRPEQPLEQGGGAPAEPPAVAGTATDRPEQPAEQGGAEAVAPATARLLVLMAAGTGVELLLGLAALILVPLGRPSEWLPAKGESLYVAHALVGAALAVGGLLVLVRTARAHRLARIGAWVGAVGLAVGLAGGVLATYHPARLAGMGFMLVGAMVAGFGYLMPVVA